MPHERSNYSTIAGSDARRGRSATKPRAAGAVGGTPGADVRLDADLHSTGVRPSRCLGAVGGFDGCCISCGLRRRIGFAPTSTATSERYSRRHIHTYRDGNVRKSQSLDNCHAHCEVGPDAGRSRCENAWRVYPGQVWERTAYQIQSPQASKKLAAPPREILV